MQLTRTVYGKELLNKWKNEEVTEEKITGLLRQYVRSYERVISNKTQRAHFENYLKGLMSNLRRKSVEPIEQCFEECKGYLGMGHFEGRSYIGFLRHLLFVMIAHFFVVR